MRILQIIDSLEAGGAERMAVNYANALADEIAFSGLVVTRNEGPLLSQVSKKVAYLMLNKKRAIDIKAVFKLRKFVKQNKVEVVHAHSTSFFITFLLKLTCPRIKIIWHDHYGDSDYLDGRPVFGLKLVIPFFNGVIAVNQKLKIWSEQKMNCKNVVYFPNFPSEDDNVLMSTILKGVYGKRIVCLANLRLQKNHFLLLEVAKKVKITHIEWTFHLVGKIFDDLYSKQIENEILKNNLEESVFLYGSKQDIKNILDQSNIAILTSQSEGLPVALLEYGWYGKPVVVTDVGEISLLIQHGVNGYLVVSNDSDLFYDTLVKLIENKDLQFDFGKALQQTIINNYSKEIIVKQYLNWL